MFAAAVRGDPAADSAARVDAERGAGAHRAGVRQRDGAAVLRPGRTAARRGQMPAGSTMAKIQQRGRLIAGVSADTYLLGSRNPFNGRIEGFDIDLVKAMAKAIFGNENAYELRVITAAQRIPSLQEGTRSTSSPAT